MDMQPIEPRPFSATLAPEQWNIVLYVLRNHAMPFEISAPIINARGVACSDTQAVPTQKYGLRMTNSTTLGVLSNFIIGPVAGSGNSVALVDPVLAGKTPNAANDAAAATAGVQVGQWYRSGSVMMQRVA